MITRFCVIYSKEQEIVMSDLPKDPVMLLSVVNTNLRDYYSDLDEFCRAKDYNRDELVQKLSTIGYEYDEGMNQFK